MTIRWPGDVLSPRSFSVDLASRTLAGPASISGVTQVVSSDAGIWRVSFAGVPVVDAQTVKCWRAIATLLEGRLNTIVVPVSRFFQPLWTESENALLQPQPHSDGAYISDGSGYVGAINHVSLAASSALRSVTLNVNIAYGGLLEPGQHFSIGERLYRIRTVDYTSDTTATLTIRPPLRESVSVGERLEIDDPVCRVRLASDAEMDLALDYGRWGFPDVNFIEDL